jgi:hypothetical protein
MTLNVVRRPSSVLSYRVPGRSSSVLSKVCLVRRPSSLLKQVCLLRRPSSVSNQRLPKENAIHEHVTRNIIQSERDVIKSNSREKNNDLYNFRSSLYEYIISVKRTHVKHVGEMRNVIKGLVTVIAQVV